MKQIPRCVTEDNAVKSQTVYYRDAKQRDEIICQVQVALEKNNFLYLPVADKLLNTIRLTIDDVLSDLVYSGGCYKFAYLGNYLYFSISAEDTQLNIVPVWR